MNDFSFDQHEDGISYEGHPHEIGTPDGDGGGAQPRRSFLGRSLAAVASVPALVMAGSSTARAQNRDMNFLPTLYPGWNSRNFQAIMRHERAHVLGLRALLGSRARPKPTFKNLRQPNVRTFATVAQVLENTGVGAYLGAVPALRDLRSQFLDEAASIALIEARHAGYLNVLLNDQITMNVRGAEQNFEMPLQPGEVVQLASPFIQSLNGGPDPLVLNDDIDILNFALLLEELEADFYNINVPRFFGGGGSQPQRAEEPSGGETPPPRTRSRPKAPRRR